MENTRDIVVIVFSVTGTVASIVLLFMCIKLYPRVSQALERVGRASDDFHEVAEGARSGMRLAKDALDIVGPALPGSGWFRITYLAAAAIPRVVRLVSRFKGPPALGPGESGKQRDSQGTHSW